MKDLQINSAKIRIHGEWLVEEVDTCTCGGGFDVIPHEFHCGIEPLIRLDELVTVLDAHWRKGGAS